MKKKKAIKREAFLLRLRPDMLAEVRAIAEARQVPIVQIMRDLIAAGLRVRI